MQVTLSLDSLLSMGRGGNVIRFINLASAALAQGFQHDDLRLLLMRRLAERGLLRRVRAFAENLSAEARARPDFAAMLNSLQANGADGYVPWHRLRDGFESNLAVLRRRYAWADQVALAWAAEERHLELHQTTDGAWQVFDLRQGSSGGWRPAFADHRPQPHVDVLSRQFKDQILAPLVIEGVGLGLHLPWLYAATADTYLGASALIYQIEPSWLALAVALHLGDWHTPLADERVQLCCGPDAYEQFEGRVVAGTWNVPPARVVRPLPWDSRSAGVAQQRIAKLVAQRESQAASVREAACSRYRERDCACWHRRYVAALSGDGPPLRVLGIASRFTTVLQYSLRDALEALRANGCETRTLIEPTNFARIPPERKLAVIRDYEPDLVLLIDHTRHGQAAGLIDNLPVVTWVQDRLPWLFCREAAETLGPLDFCMGFGARELVQQYGYPAGRFLACEMATNPAALFPRADGDDESRFTEEKDPRLDCEVAYATSLSQTPEQFYEDYGCRAAQHLQALIAATYEELVSLSHRCELDGALRWDCLIERLEKVVGIGLRPEERTELANGLARPLADRLLRQQTIEWVAAWAESTGHRFHLYGNGWDRSPFARFARGFIKHGPALGQAFRAARINLHTGCNPAVHQRVLDGLAAGGFFLIRRNAGDVANRVMHLMAAAVRERQLQVGDRLGPRDLAPAPREQWLAHRRQTGATDPFEPVQLTPELLDQLSRWSASAVGPLGGFSPEIHVAGDLWPELDRVTFGRRDELVARLEWFLEHDGERRAIATSMRARVLDVLSYRALMARLLPWMTEILGRS